RPRLGGRQARPPDADPGRGAGPLARREASNPRSGQRNGQGPDQPGGGAEGGGVGRRVGLRRRSRSPPQISSPPTSIGGAPRVAAAANTKSGGNSPPVWPLAMSVSAPMAKNAVQGPLKARIKEPTAIIATVKKLLTSSVIVDPVRPRRRMTQLAVSEGPGQPRTAAIPARPGRRPG